MDRLQAMQTFIRVVETGSFSAVARELASTQSAISKQVAALEKYLGVRLLARTTRTLNPTDDGLRYFEEARRLVGEIDEAEALLRHGEHSLSGSLRVASSVGYGLRILLPLVQSFMQKHPDVRLDLKLDEGLVDLVEHGIDVAVRIGPLADSALIARRVATSQRLLVAGKKYLAKLDGKQPWPRIPQDLMDHACLVYTGLLPRNQWEFRTADGSVVTVRVQGPLQSNNSEVLRAAILDGMGIGYLPDWLLSDLLASGDVLVLMSDWQVAPIPVHLVSPAERRYSAKVRAFGDHVLNALATPAK